MRRFLEKYGVVLITIYLFFTANYFFKFFVKNEQVIRADGKGYYAYLPAVFIYHDKTFSFLDAYEKKYYKPEYYADFRNEIEGKEVDKYFSGLAILWLPFFLIAHALAHLGISDPDGYSKAYQYAILLSAVIYTGIGLKFLQLLLDKYLKSPLLSLLIAGMIAFGTNLYQYASWDESLSHAYSFALVCIFAYAAWSFFHAEKKKWLFVAAAAFGLIVAIRPVNVLMAGLLPFLAGDPKTLIKGVKRMFYPVSHLLLAVLLFAFPLIIQSLLWYWSTDHFIVYSYGGESFDFLHPHPLQFLFGYAKGWFLWTPLAFLGMMGFFFYLKKKDWFSFLSIMIFFGLVVYVLSSWWNVTYGASFGMRPMIDYLAVPAIGLAVLFRAIKAGYAKALLTVLCIFFVYMNLVQAYQYRNDIIKWDHMKGREYWKVFLRTSDLYVGSLHKAEIPEKKPVSGNIRLQYLQDYERLLPGMKTEGRTTAASHSGHFSERLDEKNHFSALWKMPIDSLLPSDSMMQVSLWFNGKFPLTSLIVVSLEDSGQIVSWSTTKLNAFLEDNKPWSFAVFRLPLDNLQNAKVIKTFVWNSDTDEKLYVDDLKVDIIEKKTK